MNGASNDELQLHAVDGRPGAVRHRGRAHTLHAQLQREARRRRQRRPHHPRGDHSHDPRATLCGRHARLARRQRARHCHHLPRSLDDEQGDQLLHAQLGPLRSRHTRLVHVGRGRQLSTSQHPSQRALLQSMNSEFCCLMITNLLYFDHISI